VKIFVVVGMPASGKSIAREYARTEGYPYFSTGDIVRSEVESRGMIPVPEVTAKVADELRGPERTGITRIALEKALEQKDRIVFLEGMRSWPEIELIRKHVEAIVVAFVAPRSLRRQRIVSRGRPDDSPAAFDKREKREIAFGASVPIALADAYVLNTKTMEESFETFHEIVLSRGGSGK